MLKIQNDQGINALNKGKREALGGISHDEQELFDNGLPEFYAILSYYAKRVDFSPQDIIYHEGDRADTAFAIRHGLVKLISYLPNGQARIVRLHAEGSLLGLGGLLGQTYEHTAMAIDEVNAYQIPLSVFRHLKQEDPPLYCRLIECWYSYLMEADTWIMQFSTGAIRARVARLISFLPRLESGLQSQEVKLLTCEEMAAILGVTPESVSRVLAEFKRREVLRPIKTRGKNIYEWNISALEAAAQE